MMDKDIKKQLKEYKEKLLREKLEREQLINSKTDWAALEQFIQRCNENPDLRIDIQLRDGTAIHLQTVSKKHFDPYIGE
jgi:hypothetical protein